MSARTLPSPTSDDLKFFSDHPRIADPGVKQRIVIERSIVRRAVTDILAASPCYRILVHDGEEVALERSRDLGAIMAKIMATGEETLFLYQPSGIADACYVRMGWISLIYGNDGWDVIADHSDNEITNKLLAGASEYADQLCEAMLDEREGQHAEQGTPDAMTGQQSIAALAAEHNVDPGALRSLIEFLRTNIETNADLRAIMLSGDDQAIDTMISAGVRVWRDHSTRILYELAHGSSDWTREARKQIGEEVWTEIRARKGLPA